MIVIALTFLEVPSDGKQGRKVQFCVCDSVSRVSPAEDRDAMKVLWDILQG